MTKFESGKTYGTRSICDYDCIFKITVISRTEKMLKVNVHGFGEKTLKVSTKYTSNEQVWPLGKYSMACSIEADEIYAS